MRTAKRLILFLIIPLFFLTDYAKASSAKPGGSMGEGLSELSREMKKIDLYLFHSEECGSCQNIIPGLTERLEAMYPSLKVILLDLKEPENYEALCNFERRLGRRGEELPFAVIGNHLLTGEREITQRLDPIILEYLLKEPTRPIPESKGYENPSQGEVSARRVESSTELIYFHQSGCAKCGRTDVLLDYLKRKYQKLSIKKIDLSTPEGKRMGEAISERINLPDRERLTAPSILIGEKFLSAKEISEERIEEILLGLKRNPSPIVIQPEEMMKAENSIIERFKSLGPIPVAFGGLIDGINPCAFATLIFLVSYLTLTGRKREEVLKVGLVFTGSVFMTYLLIGLGIISFVQHFSFTPVLSRGIYLLASVFALAMGGLSFYDFLMWERGKEKEMKLQLPRSLKRRIHKTVRGVDVSKYQLPGAVFLGLIVSLFEFTCTGQVYLPTIIFVMSLSELRKNGFFYLLLYNFAFIIPLLSVFGLFYLGVTQRRFGLFLQKRGALIKLLTSIFFFLLGAVMLATIF
ncbi:MAG: hypothetical protein AB1502_17500 [Thermodesulfobacteriota bacterium]